MGLWKSPFSSLSLNFQISELDRNIVGSAIACLTIGVVSRIFLTVGIALGDQLNIKEKVGN